MKRRYLVVPAIILLFSCISLFWVFDFLLNRKEDNIRSTLEIEAARSEGVIVDRFNQTFAILDNINLQIKENPRDKKYINNILTKYKTNLSLTNTLSWTVFSWADEDNKIVVDTIYGIMKEPFDLSIRDYIPLTMKKPGVFYLGKPAIGSTSKKWMIPGGVGLNDKNGNYVGSMTIGFEINALARIIQKSLQNQNIKVTLIYDQNNLPVLYANSKHYNSFYNQTTNVGYEGVNKILAQLKSSDSNQVDDIALVRNQYGYLARKVENYPFILVLEYDKNAIVGELWSSIISKIYEVFLIIFAAAALLYLIYKREQQTKLEIFLKHQLHDSNLRLKALNKSVNHDLRNYISGILGLAEVIAEDKNLKKEDVKEILKQDQEYARMIVDQAEIMLKFSRSLMTDEGIENNLEMINEEDFENVDVARLIKNLIDLKKPFIKEQEVSVKTDLEEGLPMLKTNPIEMRKILDNLITNAMKYSLKGGEVVIKMRADVQAIKIEITDNGIGMTKEEIKRALAGENHSIDKSGLDKEIDSHGIGLQIVKQAVKNLGAKMEIKSEKGKGTKIKLWFRWQ